MPTPVLYIHHRPEASGAARSLATVLASLDRRYEAHVLTPPGAASDAFAAAGAVVHHAPVPAFVHTWDVQYRGARTLLLARELARLPPHTRALRALLGELAPALVHLNDGVLLPSARLAHGPRPVLWHLRSSLPNGGADSVSRIVAAAISRWGAAAIAIDEDVARTFPVRIPVAVVPNPVEVDDAPPASLPVPVDRVTIGLLGYLRRQKGWPELLEAIATLARERLPVHLVVIGGDVREPSFYASPLGRLLERSRVVVDEERALLARAAELGIADHVTILPFTQRPGPLLRALDVVVFANQGAGLGRPVLEGAAYGKPVVASGSPSGAGLLLPGKTGLLVERGPAPLADALRRLVCDPAERCRLGAAAAEHAVRRFAPAAASRAIEQVYEEVLSGRGGTLGPR